MQKSSKLFMVLTVLLLGWGLPVHDAQALPLVKPGSVCKWNCSIGKVTMSPISPRLYTVQNSPEPPAGLTKIADTIRLPSGYQSGLTISPEGYWALLVRVPSGTATPVASIESLATGYPVVYQVLPTRIPVARPAYPSRGE